MFKILEAINSIFIALSLYTNATNTYRKILGTDFSTNDTKINRRRKRKVIGRKNGRLR